MRVEKGEGEREQSEKGFTRMAEEQMIEIRPGRRIRVRDIVYSESTRASMFFVHGSCATLDQFDELLQSMETFLKDNCFSVHLFDAVGCGSSDKPCEHSYYSECELQADLVSVFERSKSDTNFIVAHSYGTSQALKLCSQMREETKRTVKGIILISGAMGLPGGGHPIMILPCFLLNWIQPSLSSAFVRAAFHESAPPFLLERALRRSNSNPMYMCKNFYRQTEWFRIEDAATIAVKALVIHGKDDKVLSADHSRIMADVLPHAELRLIERSSHQVVEEKPDETAAAIQTFVLTCLE